MSRPGEQERDRQALQRWEQLWLDPDWDRVLGYRRYPGDPEDRVSDED